MTSMRLILAAAVLAGLAVAAPTCATATSTNDLYDAITGCSQYTNCTQRLCTAAGSTNNTNSIDCLGNATSTWKAACASVKRDAKNFIMCLNTAAFAGDCQSGSAGFGDLGMALAMVMGSSEYAGSSVQTACSRQYCLIQVAAGVTCAAGTNDSEVCMYDSSNDTNTTPPAPPATPPVTTAAPSTSGAASVSTAVLAVLATVALLL